MHGNGKLVRVNKSTHAGLLPGLRIALLPFKTTTATTHTYTFKHKDGTESESFVLRKRLF